MEYLQSPPKYMKLPMGCEICQLSISLLQVKLTYFISFCLFIKKEHRNERKTMNLVAWLTWDLIDGAEFWKFSIFKNNPFEKDQPK